MRAQFFKQKETRRKSSADQQPKRRRVQSSHNAFHPRRKSFVCFCPASIHTHTHIQTQMQKHRSMLSTEAQHTRTHTPIPRRRRTLAKRKETKQIDRIQVKSCAPRNTAAVARPLSGSEAQCDAAGMYVHQQPSSPPPSFPSFHRAVLARSRLSICFVVTEKKKNAVLCPTESKNWTHSCS